MEKSQWDQKTVCIAHVESVASFGVNDDSIPQQNKQTKYKCVNRQ